MQSELVLFLGTVRRGEFESLQSRNIPLGILIDTNSKARLGDISKFVVVERFDFSRPLSELVDAVRGIQNRHKLACLYNVVEFYVAHTAAVAEALGLPGVASESARLCLDKSLMRERFRDRIGESAVARFRKISSAANLLESANVLKYPVFLQPANVSASMWATRNDGPQALVASYRAIKREVPKYYERLGRKDTPLTVVLAEYLDGKNTSIDCVVDQAGRVTATPPVDVLTGRDVGIDDYHHFARLLPSRLSVGEHEELTQLAVAGVKALDLSASAAHVEFIGRRLGEIGARPGGNRARILELAFGMDLLHAYYQVLRGQSPELRQTRKMGAAIVTPFARENGVLRNINYLDRIPSLPGYLYHEIRAQAGQEVGLSKDGFRAPLYIELNSENVDDIRRSVDEIASWTDLYGVE